MFNEFMNIGRENRKDTVSLRVIEWLIYFTVLSMMYTRTVFNKATITESGFPISEYPTLHSVLYEWMNTIGLASGLITLIWFTMDLKKSALRY